jgi:hypothetical protein
MFVLFLASFAAFVIGFSSAALLLIPSPRKPSRRKRGWPVDPTHPDRW